jgi:hypothetical protein
MAGGLRTCNLDTLLRYGIELSRRSIQTLGETTDLDRGGS